MSLSRKRLLWVSLFSVLILSAFIVPYLPFLSNTTRVYGAFLFWNLFALAVITCLVLITAPWRDSNER